MNTTSRLLAALALTAAMGGAQAASFGPAFPPPGTFSYSTVSGTDAGNAGGITFEYDFGADVYNFLAHGPDLSGAPAPLLFAGLDGTLHQMSYIGLSGNTATWGTTSPWAGNGVSGPLGAVPIEFRVTLTDTSGGAPPAGVSWVDPITLGAPPPVAAALGQVVSNDSAQDYRLNWQLLANIGGGFTAFNSIQQLQANDGDSVHSLAMAFYGDTIDSVPEPASLLLLAVAVTALSLMRRRRPAAGAAWGRAPA